MYLICVCTPAIIDEGSCFLYHMLLACLQHVKVLAALADADSNVDEDLNLGEAPDACDSDSD